MKRRINLGKAWVGRRLKPGTTSGPEGTAGIVCRQLAKAMFVRQSGGLVEALITPDVILIHCDSRGIVIDSPTDAAFGLIEAKLLKFSDWHDET